METFWGINFGDVSVMDADFKERIKKSFIEFLRGRGMRLTKERIKILEVIVEWKGHFSAEDICKEVKGKGDGISRASVYNTIGVLVEGGFLRSYNFDNQRMVYEVSGKFNLHNHFICRKCGRAIEFCYPPVSKMAEDISRMLGSRMERWTFFIEGVCKNCLNEKG